MNKKPSWLKKLFILLLLLSSISFIDAEKKEEPTIKKVAVNHAKIHPASQRKTLPIKTDSIGIK